MKRYAMLDDTARRQTRRALRMVGIAGIVAIAAAMGPAMADEALSAVFERVRDSVVVIETVGRDVPENSRQLVTVGGLGSGVLVDSLGQVLTAAHVVQTAEEVKVHFRNGDVYKGKVLSSAQAADLAMIKLDRVPTGVAVATVGDSDDVKVGDEIFIVGAPLGISYTLTVGHISARRQANNLWGGFAGGELLQTDAAINHGNSGGPMFNMKGEVVGIVSSMMSRSGGYEGLGFVVASNTARELVMERKVPWTGLDGFLVAGEMAGILNLPQEMGVLVQRVAENSPAQGMGLKAGTVRSDIGGEVLILGGDIILAVQGVKIAKENMEKIRAMLQDVVPGETIKMTVLRSGKRVEVSGVLIQP